MPAAAAPDRDAAKRVSFEDWTGENPGGLDVTRVDASNAQFDDAPERGRAWSYRLALRQPVRVRP